MSDFREFLDKQLQDPEFKKEWDALEPEFATAQARIDAKKATVQRQLATPIDNKKKTVAI